MIKMLKPRLKTLDLRLRPLPKKTEPFYGTADWKRLVASLIARRGRRCEDPDHQGDRDMTGKAIYGDHIHELRDHGPALDPANIMLRCASCHGRKTKRAAAERFGLR